MATNRFKDRYDAGRRLAVALARHRDSAALQVVRSLGPERVLLAAPVAAPDSVQQLRQEANEVVVLEQPPPFNAIEAWYEDFGQTSDDEVSRLLAQARVPHRAVWPPTRMWCSASMVPTCGAPSGWRSCRAQATCSVNPARSRQLRDSPSIGSSTTSQRSTAARRVNEADESFTREVSIDLGMTAASPADRS